MFNNGNCMSVPVVTSLDGSNNGFGDGGWEWIWVILIFALFSGNGFGFGGFGSGSGAIENYVLGSDFATIQRQLSDGFNYIDNALDRQNTGICNLGYNQLNLTNGINTNIMQGNNAIQTQLADCCCKTQQNIKDTQYAIATTGAGIQSAIKDCCCDIERQNMQTNYNMATQNCATLQAIDKPGDRIIEYMANDKAQALRDENFSLKLASSQAMQNNYLLSRLQPTPVPAFNVPSPFVNYGQTCCGCNVG